jgi:hypothetical protein
MIEIKYYKCIKCGYIYTLHKDFADPTDVIRCIQKINNKVCLGKCKEIKENDKM